MSERKVSFQEAKANYENNNPSILQVSGDWVEDGVKKYAYLFAQYADLILTDRDDILGDHVGEGNFKF
jgi:hypothetical protein